MDGKCSCVVGVEWYVDRRCMWRGSECGVRSNEWVRSSEWKVGMEGKSAHSRGGVGGHVDTGRSQIIASVCIRVDFTRGGGKGVLTYNGLELKAKEGVGGKLAWRG